MKSLTRVLAALAFAIPALAPMASHADAPGRHPYYLHALSDLRTARWLIEHKGGDWEMHDDEHYAVSEIEAAIGEIKHASVDDGKNIDDYVPMDAPRDREGRLHQALEILHKVHSDVAREEDDPYTRGLRDRAVGHIDNAMHATERAVHDGGHAR
jgi:hypothetical protein